MTERVPSYGTASDRGVRLLGDRLLVQKLDQRRRAGSTIVIPDALKQEGSTEFLVLACGPGRTTEEGQLIPMQVRPGDRVAVGRYSGVQIVIEDESYYVIRESEVLMVLLR